MNIHNDNSLYYENLEFNLTTGTTDHDLDENESTFLSSFGPTKAATVYPSHVHIRTNQTISVKLNSTSNHAITITSTDSPLTITGVKITNVFLSNSSGSTAAVKLLFTNNPN